MNGQLLSRNLDPVNRRKLLFSLSQPTNPVAGSLLAHIEQQVTVKAIHAWEKNGWIMRSGGCYVLTNLGSSLLQEKSQPPPDGYNAIEFVSQRK